MQPAKLYTKPLCGWCQEAKAYLRDHNIPFEEVNVARDAAAFAEMQKLSGQTYVPVLVLNGQVLADFDVKQLEAFLTKHSQ